MATFEDQLDIVHVLGGKDGEALANKLKERDAALQKFGQRIPERLVWSGRSEEVRGRMRRLAGSSAEFCLQLPGFAKELERKYDGLRRDNPDKFPHRVSLEKSVKERINRVYWFDDAELGTKVMPEFSVYREVDGKSAQFRVPAVNEGSLWNVWCDQIKEISELLLGIVDDVVNLGWYFPFEVISFVNSFGPAPGSEYSIHAGASAIYDIQRVRNEPGNVAGEHKAEGSPPPEGSRPDEKTLSAKAQARETAKIIFEMSAQIDGMRKSVELMESSFRLAPQKFETVLELVNLKKQSEALTALVERLNRVQ
ncbi:MAG: hypothetical protein KGL39_01255 [Patescibacteria group bacterium]|nr:hypothetical protein [Patescibacteria group bacterium]